MPQILTMDGKYRLSGGDLAEMAARWHAEHPQTLDERWYFEPAPWVLVGRACFGCEHYDHRSCTGRMARLAGSLNAHDTVPCPCDHPRHAEQVAS